MPGSESASISWADARSRSRLRKPGTLRQRLQARIFHGQVPELLRTAGNFGGRQQPADLLEAVGHLLEAQSDGFLHYLSVNNGAAFSGIVTTRDKAHNMRSLP